MAGHPLQLLRGVRVRGPARAARRTGGQAVRRLELRVRDRGDRARPGGQVPGHLAAAKGKPWFISQPRPGQALGFFVDARRGHAHGAVTARRDGPVAARRHGRAGRRRRAGHGPVGRASGAWRVPILGPASGSRSSSGLRRAFRVVRRLPRPRVHAARRPAVRRQYSERDAGAPLPGRGSGTVGAGRAAAAAGPRAAAAL